jgi:hypothetical protein
MKTAHAGFSMLVAMLGLFAAVASGHQPAGGDAPGIPAASPTTQPAGAAAQEGAPMKVIVTAIEGIAQVRASASDPWHKPIVGQEYLEGAEFRTGPASAVQFQIPPDQVITLDRLGTLKILRASFKDGKIVTDLGMKYGRTRYDIEAGGRAYDAKVHSPNSVLAIRGTHVSLYDQPPFAPEAVSLTGRASFTDAKKSLRFGGTGKTEVDTQLRSPAELALSRTLVDPRGKFSGRTEAEQAQQLALTVYGGSDFSTIGVLALIQLAREGKFNGTVTGVLPIQSELVFTLSWTSPPGAATASVATEIDLTVTSPLGEVLSPKTPAVPSGGVLQNVGPSVNGSGFETAIWPTSFPPGVYGLKLVLVQGTSVPYTLTAILNPTTIGAELGPNGQPFTGTLTTDNPTQTNSVDAVTSGTPGLATATVLRKQAVAAHTAAKQR